jgi:hypothetical protein
MTVINTEADARVNAPALRGPGGARGGDLAGIAIAAAVPFELSGLGVFLTRLVRRGRRGVRGRRSGARSARLVLLLLGTLGMLGLAGCACFTSVYQTYTVAVTGSSSIAGVSPQSFSVVLSVGEQ